MFDLHRTTAEKYLRTAVEQGGLVRHGRCGIFSSEKKIIEFDLNRYSYLKKDCLANV